MSDSTIVMRITVVIYEHISLAVCLSIGYPDNMKLYIFSDDELTPRDYKLISRLLDSITRAPERIYADDVLKLARTLNLSVEDTIEVMGYKKKPKA